MDGLKPVPFNQRRVAAISKRPRPSTKFSDRADDLHHCTVGP